MNTKPKRRPKLWKILTPEDKKGVVRALLTAGYTREAIGKALGTTKNAVVGFQHKKLPKMTGRNEGTLPSVPEDVLRPLVSSVWPEEEPGTEDTGPVLPESFAAAPEVKRPKLAASEATQCTFHDTDNRRCGFEWTDPSTKRCDAHAKLR